MTTSTGKAAGNDGERPGRPRRHSSKRTGHTQGLLCILDREANIHSVPVAVIDPDVACQAAQEAWIDVELPGSLA